MVQHLRYEWCSPRLRRHQLTRPDAVEEVRRRRRLAERRQDRRGSEWDGILCTRNVLDTNGDGAEIVPAGFIADAIDT